MNSNYCLTDHLLIATPKVNDSVFANSLIYVLDHTENGASGIIINQQLDINLDVVYQPSTRSQQEEEEEEPQHLACSNTISPPLFFGGPVASNHLFILHGKHPQQWQETHTVSEHIALTTSEDIIHAIATNTGPDKLLIALGYAGWEAKQLEQELLDNAWIGIPASEDILFHTPADQRLIRAHQSLGTDISLLNPETGHA